MTLIPDIDKEQLWQKGGSTTHYKLSQSRPQIFIPLAPQISGNG
jgi:hypothetical protein